MARVPERIWYFGYGSNMKSAVMEGRGIRVLAKEVVSVPSHKLSFEVFGVPYSEPAMASISLRGAGNGNDNVAVHGVAFLISTGDYEKLLLSEGAHTAYQEVQLEAIVVDSSTENGCSRSGRVGVDGTATKAISVHTLMARYPFRPHNPARPSRRYLNLLIEGATEHRLPASYRAFLESLPAYGKPMTRGGSFFQALWLPPIQAMMRVLKKRSSSKHVESQQWPGRLVWLVFSAMWLHHDWIHSKLVGAGDGTFAIEELDQNVDSTVYEHTFAVVAFVVCLAQEPETGMDSITPIVTDPFLSQAQELLAKSPLIDGHNDFAYNLRGYYNSDIDDPSWSMKNIPIGQTDLTRLRQGQVGGQFWSAFVPCPTKLDDFSTQTLLPSLLSTLQQIDLIHAIIKSNPQQLALAENADDIIPTFKSGRIASMIGIEGLHQICNSASVLRMLHRLGVRYATLNHNSNTKYSDSAASVTKSHGGLTEEGKAMILEMNRIGMIIDLAHTSHDTQRDVLALSKAPVIHSHSSCHALTPHDRNVPDDILQNLRVNRGLLMICFLPSLTRPSANEPSTLSCVADHIVHAGTIMGYEHVGLGSDFDGMLEGPEGLDDVSRYPYLVAELLRRGVSELDVRAVCGLNVIRVMREVEGFARRETEAGSPMLVDEIRGVWTEEQREMVRARGERRVREQTELNASGSGEQ